RVVGPRYETMDPSASPLLGRERELKQLRLALQAALDGHGSALHVIGDAGIGKSRMVRELRADLPTGVVQVIGRCVSFEVERPYALLARLLRDIVRVPAGHDETAAREVCSACWRGSAQRSIRTTRRCC